MKKKKNHGERAQRLNKGGGRERRGEKERKRTYGSIEKKLVSRLGNQIFHREKQSKVVVQSNHN